MKQIVLIGSMDFVVSAMLKEASGHDFPVKKLVRDPGNVFYTGRLIAQQLKYLFTSIILKSNNY